MRRDFTHSITRFDWKFVIVWIRSHRVLSCMEREETHVPEVKKRLTNYIFRLNNESNYILVSSFFLKTYYILIM